MAQRKGFKHTLETRKKMSEAHKGLNTWMKGRKLSEETKRKISVNSAKVWLGKLMSEEHKRKVSLGHLGQVAWNKGMKGFRGGEESHFWKGGITPVNLRLRTSLEYREWRNSIFKRDNYTCVECGDNQGGNLEVDHYPIPFSAILNKLIVEQGLENLYEKALKYDIFWILDNGRTLCKSCHKRTETWGEKAKRFKLNE